MEQPTGNKTKTLKQNDYQNKTGDYWREGWERWKDDDKETWDQNSCVKNEPSQKSTQWQQEAVIVPGNTELCRWLLLLRTRNQQGERRQESLWAVTQARVMWLVPDEAWMESARTETQLCRTFLWVSHWKNLSDRREDETKAHQEVTVRSARGPEPSLIIKLITDKQALIGTLLIN